MCFLPPRNQSETLTQNYRRLGLTARLNAMTGGNEDTSLTPSQRAKKDSLSLDKAKFATELNTATVRVERAPDGSITRVIHAPITKSNPLNDPLNDLSDTEDVTEIMQGIDEQVQHVQEHQTEVVRRLERQAKEAEARPRRARKLSAKEGEWIQKLTDRWGEDYKAMRRDRVLNVMQQSEGDLRRRVMRWRQLEREGP